MSVFLLLTLIRILFPFEFSFTKNINMPEKVSSIITRIIHPYYHYGCFDVSVWVVIQIVWFCGIIVALGKLLYSHHVFNRYILRYGKDITSEESILFCLNAICDNRNASLKIISVPKLKVPCQGGIIRPNILIPVELNPSPEELKYILAHELSHIRHHDTWIKLGINILTALYWWNPVAHILRDKTDILLEMRVDNKLVHSDESVRKAYMDTLIHVAEYALSQENSSAFMHPTYIAMASGGFEDLEQRTHMIYREKKTSLALLLSGISLIALVYLVSYRFILEPHYIYPEHKLSTQEIFLKDMCAHPLDDGTYDLYSGDFFIENVDSLEYYGDINIINE